METPRQFEVPWGVGAFDIILTLWRLQGSLKFHGGGNFDITLAMWRPQVSLKFYGGAGILISS